MQKLIILLFTAAIFVIAPSCSTSRDVNYRSSEERVNDDGVVIKRKKRVVKDDNDRDVTLKVRKERKDRNRRNRDEPVIVIDPNR
jgi:hypothetical protein